MSPRIANLGPAWVRRAAGLLPTALLGVALLPAMQGVCWAEDCIVRTQTKPNVISPRTRTLLPRWRRRRFAGRRSELRAIRFKFELGTGVERLP